MTIEEILRKRSTTQHLGIREIAEQHITPEEMVEINERWNRHAFVSNTLMIVKAAMKKLCDVK